MLLPASPDLIIKGFSGATITRLEAGITNGMVDNVNGVLITTQRPSIDLFDQATSIGNRGRAIYFWDLNNTLYFLNDDTIYKTSSATGLATTITAGTKKCKFLQLNQYLILLDPSDNKGYYITSGDAVTQIASNFPATIVPGGAILDGYCFVMSPDGTIWNSNLDDVTTWGALDSINAEREEDGGVYLGKHHDHIVAFGERTIEFFYDNANPTNSPLNRREDLSYTIGCADGYSVWDNGDQTVFIGTDLSNGIGVYVLNRFSIKKVSTNDIDLLLSQATTRDEYEVVGGGFTAQGHTFYTLTLHTTPTDITPEATYVFDLTAGKWYIWETSVGTQSNFPLVDFTIRAGTDARFGQGIMANGDIILVNNDLTPQDTIAASTYVTTGYVDAGYISDTSAQGAAMTTKIRLGHFDGETNKNKFMNNLRPRMEKTTASQTMTVRWADDNEDTFIEAGSFDTQYQYNSLRRCGRFNRRNIELEFSSTEQIWVESLEADIKLGTI